MSKTPEKRAEKVATDIRDYDDEHLSPEPIAKIAAAIREAVDEEREWIAARMELTGRKIADQIRARGKA